MVEVADNGVGIDPEQRDKIFLPFFTTKPTGTGLGMAIVKKIMDLHGGEIEIDSRPGQGTTVRLIIPRAALAPRSQARIGGLVMKRRILIVEDDQIFLRPLQRTLEVEGYEVMVVTQRRGRHRPAQERRRRIWSSPTSDCPAWTASTLVRRLKADHADLAVVVMTAYGTIESAVEAMRLGAADYLVKPFETAEVLMVVRHAIEFQELRAASRATLRRNQEQFTLRNVLRARRPPCRRCSSCCARWPTLDTTVLIHGETGVGKELLARSDPLLGTPGATSPSWP